MKTWTLAFVVLLASITVAPAEHTARESFQTDELVVTNLIGSVDIGGHSGRDFQVEVVIRGADADEDLIDVIFEHSRRPGVEVRFPLEDHHRYVYPELGRGSRTRFSLDRSRGFLGWLSGNDSVEVRGSGNGLEIWADVRVLVPEGGRLVLRHGVGKTLAADVEGDLDLTSRSGSMAIENVEGDLIVDTGSGRVSVDRVRGAEVEIDTGSGSVVVFDVEAHRMSVDTGSGSVEAARFVGEDLVIDTGSGSVSAEEIDADSVKIDTGSGSVTLRLDRMGGGDFEIDTGSGGITLVLPPDASAEIEADTGSGGIDLDLEDAQIRSRDRDEVRLIVGGGDARVQLDTGSGGIRIRQR